MPELPEVERTARRLRTWLRGRRIERVTHLDDRLLVEGRPQDVKALESRRIAAISRRAKYILLRTDGPLSVILHLGMTGKVVRREPGVETLYARFSVTLSGGVALHLVDPRVFGKLRFVPTTGLAKHPVIAALGPEPLSAAFNGKALGERLLGKRIALKVALMDQAVVAGIGNIQSAEGLWKARLDPFREAGKLSGSELARLVAGLKWTLTESLRRDRGPETTYVSESKDDNPFVIYGREGEPCPRCGREIQRREQAGRSTFFCARCQGIAPASRVR